MPGVGDNQRGEMENLPEDICARLGCLKSTRGIAAMVEGIYYDASKLSTGGKTATGTRNTVDTARAHIAGFVDTM